MTQVSTLELRRDTKALLERVRRGERPVARLEPSSIDPPDPEDPFSSLAEEAVDGGATLTNEEIDSVAYGS